MFLVLNREGEPEQRWEYRPGRLRVMEMEAIEKHTGLAYATEFKAQLLKGQTSARRALLWTFLRRDHQTLKYADVDFCDDELTLERTKDEIDQEISAIEQLSDQEISPEERSMTLTIFRQQRETAPDAPGKATPTDATPTP